MLLASARPGEHVTILSLTSGAVLSSGVAPEPAAIRLHGPPSLADATTFEVASYRRARRSYAVALRHDEAVMRTRARARLRAWAGCQAARAAMAPPGHADPGPGRPIQAALAAMAAWQETGVRAASRQVLAIIGMSRVPAIIRHAQVDLSGTHVVVADDDGQGGSAAALQAALIQAGASSAVVLGPASDGQFPAAVDRGLAVTISYPLARVSFARGQFRLPATAGHALQAVRYLLTVTYPRAMATVNGYTDNLAVRGGNVELSWRRARAVVEWLVRHGVSAGRRGKSATGPLSPRHPTGRRVRPAIAGS